MTLDQLKQDNEDRQLWHLKLVAAARAMRAHGPVEGIEADTHEVIIKCLEREAIVTLYRDSQ